MNEQQPIFEKYTRAWLAAETGISRGYLCRLATGNCPIRQSFIDRCCYRIGLPPEELFRTSTIRKALAHKNPRGRAPIEYQEPPQYPSKSNSMSKPRQKRKARTSEPTPKTELTSNLVARGNRGRKKISPSTQKTQSPAEKNKFKGRTAIRLEAGALPEIPPSTRL